MTERRICVILGHPDPSPARFDRALAEAYRAGAAAAGHRVAVIDLASLDVPYLRSQEEFEHGALPASIRPAADEIVAADHLVLIFPLWLGTMPALLKAFLEQIARPGLAFRYRDKGLPEKLFRGKSARIVVTMGMPALLYRVFYFAHGVAGLRRSILNFVGVAPVRTTYVGKAGGDEARRKRWLEKMRSIGGSDPRKLRIRLK